MSETLTDLFEGRVEPGIYRLTSRARAGAIGVKAARHGWRFIHLDGRHIATKAGFLRASAAALDFPAYSGRNWDALVDNLRDLAWAPAEAGYLVLYDHAGVFAAENPADFAVALDILRSTVASWRGTDTPMTVLLRGAGRAASAVPKL
jgi:Barstar (barnase inhibitor)